MSTQDATTFTSYATTTTHKTKKELCGFALQFPLLCAESLPPLSFSPLECGRVERKEVKRKSKKERGFDTSYPAVFAVLAGGAGEKFSTTQSCARRRAQTHRQSSRTASARRSRDDEIRAASPLIGGKWQLGSPRAEPMGSSPYWRSCTTKKHPAPELRA